MRLKAFIRDLYTFFIDRRPGREKKLHHHDGQPVPHFLHQEVRRATGIDTILCDSEMKMMLSLSFNYGLKNMIRVDPSIKELNFLKTMVDNSRPRNHPDIF